MTFPDLSDLSPYRRQNFLLQTVEQIHKDFSEVGIEISFTGTEQQPYKYLITKLSQLIDQLLSNQQSTLLQLLYRIDISEKAVLQVLGSTKESEEIAHLILERELKKVLLRNYFKNQ